MSAGELAEDTPLSPQQQRLMAYVDDELNLEARHEFEIEMAEDADLAIEVAGFRTLNDLTRSIAQLEPADHEMRRFWAKFYNRGEWRLGWLLIALGTIVLFGFGMFELCTAESVPWAVKFAVVAVVIGGLLLLVNTIRLKLRSHRFDRYRGVMR